MSASELSFGQEVKLFDFQARLAGDKAGAKCESRLINIPTGCGKTAAVGLAWLGNQVALQPADLAATACLLLADAHAGRADGKEPGQRLKNLGFPGDAPSFRDRSRTMLKLYL